MIAQAASVLVRRVYQPLIARVPASSAIIRRAIVTAARPVYRRTLRAVPDRHELPELLNRRGLLGTGVEIGVQEGVYSEQLLSRWRGEQLISVDPWLAAPSEEWVNTDNVEQPAHEQRYATTVARLAPFGDRSVIWRKTSDAASNQVPDRSLDYVYIDARHDYASVLEDVSLWYPKVRPGGLLAGHDYVDGLFPEGDFGVKRAVDEYLGRKGLQATPCFAEATFATWMVIVR